jgi:hypothetical protein
LNAIACGAPVTLPLLNFHVPFRLETLLPDWGGVYFWAGTEEDMISEKNRITTTGLYDSAAFMRTSPEQIIQISFQHVIDNF